ncbi:thioredoxin [Synechococcales cyanobacterium C]|uniref:Thioredoxin n=1 Tax=Petrachloros mirabilis ULC683 TaxID=2781853 RepID=A0A8K1ZYT4_9CYAN|nr:thioredoxin [Petrachloros mirabilis]NCJ06601.1 thioredoxin [Petrachloros mirabilis ULC683]
MATKKQFNSFEDMLSAAEHPVLVDFYASWCGPCRMIVPILNQVQALLKGKLQVVKIDTDAYPQLASQYDIHALPTLVLFKQGEPVNRIEGVLPAESIIDHLRPFL